MERILYTKYSNERAAAFAIRTDIIEVDGHRQVRKKACYGEGTPHIRNIYEASRKLQQHYASRGLSINKCRQAENGVYLEYLKGQTLQEKLDGLLKDKNIKEFQEVLGKYMNIITQNATEPFYETEEFQKVFGNRHFRKGLYSAPVTDIDMVLSNVFTDEAGNWTLIDYEWTFFFPIPVTFVLYRILHYYECSNAFRSQIGAWDLYEQAGITKEDRKEFQEMEKQFQSYVLGSYVPLRHLYPRISPGKTDLHTILKGVGSPERLQIFFSKDGVLREEESVYYPMTDNKVKLRFKIEEGTRIVRLDPGERSGRVKISQLEWDNGKACTFRTNGILRENGEILFLEEDPQIYLENLPDKSGILYLKLCKDSKPEGYVRQIQEDQRKIDTQREELEKLKAQLAQKEEQMAAMENTRVWKTYTKYKKMIKGE